MSAHLPEPGDYRGHGSPNIQGSTVLAGPRSNKKKEKKTMSRKHKTTHKKIKKKPNTHHLFDIRLKLRLQSREILLHICWMSLLLFCYVEIHIHTIALTPKQQAFSLQDNFFNINCLIKIRLVCAHINEDHIKYLNHHPPKRKLKKNQ